MQRATTLTVVRHDDTVQEYTDVRYTLTRAGLQILTGTGDEVHVDAHDVLTTHATAQQSEPGDA
ncbi:hypothetical protein [Krasilnikovia sp. MM14-A1259]|uniref:hypothetical protein n=1 Tax=Krasilnikovia sp. MM14-A1259 TaxID=3373539 RepID=UPI0037FD7A49